MRFRVALAVAALVTTGFARMEPVPGDLTVHEWGTFTSVAGEDGRPVAWMPLDGPIDLPCFVSRTYPVSPKGALLAKVRMETPVLYFYAPRDLSVDVRVGFKQGLITEYFPRAAVKPASIAPANMIEPGFVGAINWRNVRILPDAAPQFLTEPSPSHYYAARKTDAATLEVGGSRERFLFYRGVGNFPLPITAAARGNDVTVRAEAGAIPSMMLFENRNGRIGYRVQEGASHVRLSRPELADDEDGIDAVRTSLQQMLEAEGLYPREAHAMIETWRDSWFTQGARLFFIVPREAIDAVLPLSIDPAPASVTRVFVGRVELATDATLSDIRSAIAGDEVMLRQYGRFLRPFADRLLTETRGADRSKLAAKLERLTSQVSEAAPTCR